MFWFISNSKLQVIWYMIYTATPEIAFDEMQHSNLATLMLGTITFSQNALAFPVSLAWKSLLPGPCFSSAIIIQVFRNIS